MENRAYAFIAGLFALVLCGGLVAGFWWLGGSHTMESEYLLTSQYPVTGLKPQAAVNYRGVDVGRVRSIEIDSGNPSIILVTISIDSQVPINRGTFAQLATQGLTGLSYIELDNSGKDKAALGNAKIPLKESNLSQMLNSGKEIISKADVLEEDAGKLLKTFNRILDHKNEEKITRLIDNLDRASNELEPLLRASHATAEKASKLIEGIHPNELAQTLETVRQASGSMKETSDTLRPTIARLQQSLAEFERIGRHIEQSSVELSTTLNDETLPRVHELTRQIQQDAKSLNQLVDTLDQNPQSVIFGKPQPAPGPGEKGFQP